MKILKTKIPGLKLIKNIAHKDERGFFSETYRQKNFKKFLGKEPFCQDNHSFSKKNVLRGIHFQWKNPQSQLVYLVSGKIFVVFVDFRLNSKTFLKKFEVIIQAKDKLQYFMPAGVGSGYYSLSNLTHKIYKVNKWCDLTLSHKSLKFLFVL